MYSGQYYTCMGSVNDGLRETCGGMLLSMTVSTNKIRKLTTSIQLPPYCNYSILAPYLLFASGIWIHPGLSRRRDAYTPGLGLAPRDRSPNGAGDVQYLRSVLRVLRPTQETSVMRNTAVVQLSIQVMFSKGILPDYLASVNLRSGETAMLTIMPAVGHNNPLRRDRSRGRS